MTFAQPFSDYEVLDRVGAGSMGTVFRARHKKLNRTVALKILKPSLARDARYVERLRREARIVASLNHPNIVTGYDLGQEGGYHFVVMEFIEGKSLRELLHEWGMFAEDRVLDVAIQITTALEHAFSKGVIHRDIKPANILIDTANVVKLTDMGLAKGPDNLTITRDGVTVGTPQYISPEQARSPQDVDVRSDLYSLGATLFHMCTGQPPFRAETMANVLIKVLEERAPSAAGFNPDLSDGLNLIIRKLLSKDPGKRYQVPSDLLADLQRVQRSEAPDVDIDDLDTGEERGHRKRVLWSAVAVLAFASWFFTRDDVEPTAPTVDLRGEYRTHVVQDVIKIKKIGDKIRRIRELQIVTTLPHEKDVLASLLVQWEERLAEDLPEIFRSLYEKDSFGTLDWTEPEPQLKRRLEDRIKEEFGLEGQALVGLAAAGYRKEWSKLVRALHAFTQKREVAFTTALNEHSRAIEVTLEEILRESNIPLAESRLREEVRRFEGLGGSPPVARLPAHLRLLVERKRQDAEKSGQGKIVRAEAKLTALFGDEMTEFARLVAEWVEDPKDAVVALDRFESTLAMYFPPGNFRATVDPWKSAGRLFRQARSKIDAAKKKLKGTRFEKGLQIAYDIAVCGDLARAKANLQDWADEDDPRVPAHVAMLDHADAVRGRLLQALLSSGTRKRLKPVRTRDGTTVTDLVLVREEAAIVVHVGGAEVPLAFLNVRDLVKQAGPDFESSLQQGEKAGLAVWFRLSGQTDIATLVHEDYKKLFRDLRRVNFRAPTSESVVANLKLASIRSSIKNERYVTAETTIGDLRAAHVRFADEHEAQLRRFDKQINQGKAQLKMIARLNKLRLAGMIVDVEKNLAVTVVLDIRGTRLPEANRKGWVQDSPGPARYENDEPALAVARKQALVLPSLLDVDAPAIVTLDLTFAEENGGPRLLFVQCQGATIGLALDRDGVVTIFPVDKGLRALTGLSRKTKKSLKTPRNPQVVPGARHRFYFVTRKKRGASNTVVVRVFLDGEPPVRDTTRKELAKIDVQRPTTPSASVTLTPLSPVTLHAVEFRGRGLQ